MIEKDVNATTGKITVRVGKQPVDNDPEAILAAERSQMVCSPLQGRLALGEAVSTQLDLLAADPNTPFPMRLAINTAIEWRRNSQAMSELAYLMGYDEYEMDDLFRFAMTISV